MRNIPKQFEIYKHFKGNKYQILMLAKDCDHNTDQVVYQGLYDPFQVYTRSLNSFMEELDENQYPNATQKYRFELQENQMSQETAKEESNIELVEMKPINDAEIVVPETGYTIDPSVMEFLEANTYEERLRILVSIKHRITDDMLNTMAVAADVEVKDGDIEQRYEEFKNCLLTLEKFECNRLR